MFQTLVTFIHWKKGPEWWTKYSAYIFTAVYFSNYLVFPILNVIVANLGYAKSIR